MSHKCGEHECADCSGEGCKHCNYTGTCPGGDMDWDKHPLDKYATWYCVNCGAPMETPDE